MNTRHSYYKVTSCAIAGLLSVAAFGTVQANAGNMPLEFKSSGEQVSLLELFTSEGCSSCPPAEARLTALKKSPGLWNEFVPVAFHVDYWDRLGWADPFAKPEFSKRERVYASVWGSDSVYTPCFVLNGKEWQNGSLPASKMKPGVLSAASIDGERWKVTFTPAEGSNSALDFHAALLVGEVSSDVAAGENRGRRLAHDFAAIELKSRPAQAADAGLSASFDLAKPKNLKMGRFAAAFWVARRGHPEPIQATGGWTSPEH